MVLGPASPGSGRFYFDIIFVKKSKVTIQKKLSQCLLICLPSEARFEVFLMLVERWKIVNANVGEVCSVICGFFMVPYIFWVYFEFTHMLVKCCGN